MPERDKQHSAGKSSVLIGAVFSLASSIVVCLLAGWLLDKWLKTGPWLLVAGIILGAVVGFYQLIRVMMRVS